MSERQDCEPEKTSTDRTNGDDRRARLAAALRDNLKKRKDQARARSQVDAVRQDANARETVSSAANAPGPVRAGKTPSAD
jgi:hypothetical protein